MQPIFVLVGPTASGKSGSAIPVAKELGAEIVSLDSMALYRGMDIGTDKPRDLHGVRHHLLDLLDPAERFDLARYLADADAAISGIRERNKRVLIVGGTGLYLMGLLKGVFGGAPRDPAFRATLSGVAADTLHARLREVDEATAARVHQNDRRRIVRALEVHAVTGRPLSELQTQFEGEDRYASVVAGVRRSRDDLRRRARLRIDQMWAEGLVEEVRGLELGDTAGQAVGYKEVAGFLAGEYDEGEAKRLVLRNTMRLIRRQGTWFKRFDVHWVDAGPTDDPAALCPKLIAIYRGDATP
ncbi:MAG: tRNA (adenosine(37)-N6)-dimethylallyltransferase MiaA [Planctomycetota bacterium]